MVSLDKKPKMIDVTLTVRGKTTTFHFVDQWGANRIIKAKKNPIRNRYRICEDGRVLNGDYLYGLKKLRNSIERGKFEKKGR